MNRIVKIALLSSALGLGFVTMAAAQQPARPRQPAPYSDTTFEGRSIYYPDPAAAPNEVDESGYRPGEQNPQNGG